MIWGAKTPPPPTFTSRGGLKPPSALPPPSVLPPLSEAFRKNESRLHASWLTKTFRTHKSFTISEPKDKVNYDFLEGAKFPKGGGGISRDTSPDKIKDARLPSLHHLHPSVN